MPVNNSSDEALIYTLDIEVDLLQCSPKYPKNPKTFGERVRKKRMDLGLTMREIAEKLEVSETTVYNWEIRNIKPYRRTEEKLKTVLGLTEEISV